MAAKDGEFITVGLLMLKTVSGFGIGAQQVVTLGFGIGAQQVITLGFGIGAQQVVTLGFGIGAQQVILGFGIGG